MVKLEVKSDDKEYTFEFENVSSCCGAYIDSDEQVCWECGEHADIIKITK